MRSLTARFGLSAYALAAYLLFLVVFAYVVAFLLDAPVPKTVDSGTAGAPWPSLLVDALLLGLFAVQHSVMARPAFKRRWTRVVPAAAERSTYVLLASLALALAMWQWRPLPAAAWDVPQPWAPLLVAVSLAGWLWVVAATWMINHLDLFGLRQAYLFVKGRPYASVPFVVRGAYAVVRQPMMLGILVGVWVAPRMSAGHLLFALLSTGYVLVGTRLEERTLTAELGPAYADYRRHVPMWVPGLRRRRAQSGKGMVPARQ